SSPRKDPAKAINPRQHMQRTSSGWLPANGAGERLALPAAPCCNRLRCLRRKDPAYFLPEAALAMRLRTRLKQALQQDHPQLLVQIPRQVWAIDWVADVRAVGHGESALKYLAAYLYRTAFSAERILNDDGRFITFSYRDSRSGQTRALRLPAECFLHRFLQHVLPRGFQRVRSFGWLSAAGKTNWQRILALLDWA